MRRRNPFGETLESQMDESNIQAEFQKRMREEKENIVRIKTPIQKLESIPPNRIDEGICQSFCYQFKSMLIKFSYVLLPRSDSGVHRLRNWDLWGPFFMSIIYAFFIQNNGQFLLLFFSVFLAATIVSFNIKVIGGKVSYFQSVSILGYCIFPLFLVMMILKILLFLTIKNQVINIVLVVLGIVWCILSSRAFVAVNVPSNRKFVAMYPVILFYIFLGLVLIFN